MLSASRLPDSSQSISMEFAPFLRVFLCVQKTGSARSKEMPIED
jgi:hypothetical protein